MANEAVFLAQTKLKALGKKGKIAPDADGYYTLILGGLETHNNTGSHYYTANDVLHLFATGSLLERRIKNGCVRAEVGHPKMRPNESMDQFIQRMVDIDLNNVCAHIRKVWLDMDYGKNHPECGNPNLIAIMGEVKPEGGRGFILKEALENESANIFFSIRSIADQVMVRGKRVRKIEEVITFDLVNEGGIIHADKWTSPACESTEILPITKEVIDRIMGQRTAAFAVESTDVLSRIQERLTQRNDVTSIVSKW